jgi:molybdopterin synthase catalytic subunit
MTCEITTRPLHLGAVELHLPDPGSGAVVVFVGRVRPDAVKGRRVIALVYETDRAMALRRMRALERRARRRFAARRVYVIHRVGRIPVGGASVIIAVAAAHRSKAFAAARFLIEELKREVPIWKADRWARAPTERRRRTRPARPTGRSPG